MDTIYDDGRFQITSELLCTPTRYYPLANATVKIRRDPLWFAVGLTTLSGLTTLIYSDLLYISELAAIWGVTGSALYLGKTFAFLSVDAMGHNNTMVVARTSIIKDLYQAMRLARSTSKQGNIIEIDVE